MPLSLGDIGRLSALGHRQSDFAEEPDEEGYVRLHNKEEGSCFFLDEGGRCRVQEVKPEGCRLYPFIFDEAADKVVRDDVCPFNGDFSPPADVETRLRQLISRLETEAVTRRAQTRP